MISTARRSRKAEPAWEIARLFPYQGAWDEEDYLALDTNHLVEFCDGFIEVLPMPKTSHQLIVSFLFRLLNQFIEADDLGMALFAPLRIKLREKLIREPDIVFMLDENSDRIGEDYWDRADLVIEVVSEDPESQERDLKQKRRDYAAARIPEYWIVNPKDQRVTVLKLSGKRYQTHGVFKPGEKATSVLLPGFVVDVAAMFKAGKR